MINLCGRRMPKFTYTNPFLTWFADHSMETVYDLKCPGVGRILPTLDSYPTYGIMTVQAVLPT